MRLSKSFGKTLRHAPADAEMASHQLLIRANFVRPLGAGIYTYMPLGFRVLRKLHDILSEEMDDIDGQEMLMPNLHPAAIWHNTGRWDEMGSIMMRVDAGGSREYAMSPTHEEVVVDLVSREVESYRDLPKVVYHISKKFRDEARPRGGMIRLREFIMKDAYSVHLSEDSLDDYYPNMVRAYHSIFSRCQVPAVAVNADVGAMGGKSSHEFLYQHEQGEDSFIQCQNCDYAANVEAAAFVRTGDKPETLDMLTKVHTPDCKTIAAVAQFMGVEESQTLKAVFLWATPTGKKEKDGYFVFAVIRGDMQVNEVKLANALGGVADLRAATIEEIMATGATPGYASPVGLSIAKEVGGEGVVTIGDLSIEAGGNFVVGANEEIHHYAGINYPRDFAVTLMADIAEAETGHLCGVCKEGTLVSERAIEVGHCFKLGTRYSIPTETTALDKSGKPQHVYMGSYGIGLDRLIGVVVEAHHDKDGIVWPRSLSPYDVHLMFVGKGDEPVAIADQLYADLKAAGLSVLYDDREMSPGVKFKDADLIGIPIRIAVGKRSLENGGVEIKLRHESDRTIVAVADAIAHVKAL